MGASQIALQAFLDEPESLRMHPLSHYAREIISYNVADGVADEAHFATEFSSLVEEADQMDGKAALVEMYKTKIESAARLAAKSKTCAVA